MSDALPGVSYVVTIYNKAAHIEGVMRALANQAGAFERQFILVDDGSTDGSAELAARIVAGLPDAMLIRQENFGPSVAVNRGLAHVRLPFTQVIDGDDILAPYASRLLLKAALQSGCAGIWGRNIYYATLADIIFPREPSDLRITVLDDALYWVIRIGHAGGSTSIIDSATLKRIGGCDERVFVQDQSLPQRVAAAARIGIVDHLICMGPRDDPGRLMKRPVQQEHDQSLTAILTLADHPGLAPRFRRLVQKQVTGRAWKHAARLRGAGPLSRNFWLFLAARCPGVRLGDDTLLAALEAYPRGREVRLMPEIAARSAARASAEPGPARQSAARSDR